LQSLLFFILKLFLLDYEGIALDKMREKELDIAHEIL